MEKTESTRTMLAVAQKCLATALDELEEAKTSLEWARKKLMDKEADYRRLANVLLRYVESPDPEDCEEFLALLDKTCDGLVCKRTAKAAQIIRAYARANTYLLEENKRLQDALNSR